MLFGGYRWRLTAGMAGLIALMAGLAWALVPRGEAVAAEGRVLDFRLHETETGGRLFALVRVDSREGYVRMLSGHAYKVGDRISLWRRSARVRTTYSVRPPGCRRETAQAVPSGALAR